MNNDLFNEKVLGNWREIGGDDWQILVKEIVDIFLAVAPIQMQELEQAFKIKDYKKVAKSAHILKSSCGNVGATLAHSILNKIEYAAINTNHLDLDGLLEQLGPVFKKSISKVKDFGTFNQAA